MHLPLLDDILVIFGLSLLVLFACHRLRVPTIVGFLFTGALAGPHGLGLVRAVEQVGLLAEIGVLLLLFTIGLEFSLKRLAEIGRAVLLGGSLQVLATLLAAWLVCRQAGLPSREAVFIGCLVALSSTAIVLKLLQERGEVDAPHGRTMLAMLVYQDIAVVPMMLLVPLLAGRAERLGPEILLLLLKGAGMILLVLVSSRWLVPRLLFAAARTRIRELFLASVLAICLGVVWVTSAAGLSLALGAFLAGLIVSESEYSHRALGDILPFRDIFTSFFFVSMGMLLDVAFFARHPLAVLLVAAGVLALKTFAAGGATLLLGLPLRTAILVGLGINQIGEFSFILSRMGLDHGFLAGEGYPMFLAVSVLTMAATPLLISAAPRVADQSSRLPWPRRLRQGLARERWVPPLGKRDHLIIVGFGLNGRNLARAARAAGIDYLTIDLNPETVRRERRRGEPIFYGDATQEATLEHAAVGRARILVAAIADPAASRGIAQLARRMNPGLHLIVRTRYLAEVEPLFRLGADEVVPEEYETSVEIFTRVLVKYLVPRDEIDRLTGEIRSAGYEMLRRRELGGPSVADLERQIPGMEISSLRLGGDSPLAGRTLAEAELRRTCAVTLLALRRGEEWLVNPDAGTELRGGDVLVVLGRATEVAALARLCGRAPGGPADPAGGGTPARG